MNASRQSVDTVVGGGCSLRGILTPMFGIDVRSLAALRICAAVLILEDLALRSRYLVEHYTDYGVLPRLAWTAFYSVADQDGTKYWWSLYRLSGEPWFVAVLFGVAAVLALSLLLGYRTRLATIGSWVMLASIQARNPLILNGGDGLLTCILFWAMFLPLGAAWSMDDWLRPAACDGSQRVLSAASVAMLLQVVMVYLFTALIKTGSCWTTDHSAVYYALNLDTFTTPWGRSLLAYPALMRFFTVSSYWLEWLGPLMAFSPVLRAPLRVLVVVTFWGFHLSTVLFLHLGIFPWAMMVAWVAFIPRECWDWLSRCALPERRAAVSQWFDGVSRLLWKYLWLRCPETSYWQIGWVQSVAVSLLLLYALAWNVCGAFPRYFARRPGWNVVGRLTRLNQHWDMFAPCPSAEDGWYVMRGTLQDGSEVNLLQPGTPLPWDKPQYVYPTFGGGARNQMLLRTLWERKHIDLRGCYVDWLRQRWDRVEARLTPTRRVKKVEMIFMLELTPPPGEPLPKPEPVLLGWRSYN